MLRLTMNPGAQGRHKEEYCVRYVEPQEPEDKETTPQEELHWENLKVMLRQEKELQYCCIDYLHSKKEAEAESIGKGGRRRVDESCREQICEWTFRVVDYFQIDREVVSLSMFYLDRSLSVNLCDRRTFKLIATAALHLAVKVLYPLRLSELGILSDLSRGEFGMNDVTMMETELLHSLTWRLHPPTSRSFVLHLLTLVPPPSSEFDRDGIMDIATFFTELAVCGYSFVTHHPSTIALAAILNAMEGLGMVPSVGAEHQDCFTYISSSYVYALCNAGQRPHDCTLVAFVRELLWQTYERSEECSLHNNNETPLEAVDNETGKDGTRPTHSKKKSSPSVIDDVCSPVCVSKYSLSFERRYNHHNIRTAW